MRLNVLESRELLATIYAIRSFDKELRTQIRQHTKRIAEPEWRKALAERADTRLEHRVIVDTTTVSVSDQNVRIQSAAKGRPLSGGLNPKSEYGGVEFGSKPRSATYSRKSRNGGSHKVKRQVGTQFKPFRAKGYVFHPAATEMIPRLAALWVQTTVRTIAEALEGKK